MEKVVPWQTLMDLTEPRFPKISSKGGCPPYPLATMLRIQLLQKWYDLSDPAMEHALIVVPTMRRFAGIDTSSERIRDQITILAFCHLMEQHDLGTQIFEVVKTHLKANGLAMKQSTIIDASLIAAPSSTLTRAKPECAFGTRTRTRNGIRRCTRSRRGTTWSFTMVPEARAAVSPHRRG